MTLRESETAFLFWTGRERERLSVPKVYDEDVNDYWTLLLSALGPGTKKKKNERGR